MRNDVPPAKILRIITRLNTGGPAIHAVLLTRALDRRRFSSVLVTGVVDPSEGDMSYYASQMGVTPVVIPELGRRAGVGSLLKAFWRLWALARRERPDIIHTHTATAGGLGRVAGLFYNAACRMAGRRRAKLVHTFHGHVFHGYFSPLRSRLLVLAERVLAFFTDQIVAVSDAVKRDLVERYGVCPERKVDVIPLGFDFEWVRDLDNVAGELRSTHRIPPGAVVVGLVGRLTPIKNHALLLAALRLLRRADLRTVLMGDGELRGDVERAVRDLGLDDCIILTGWQQNRAKIYADLDIVCLTSRNEGTPVALIEAMASGKSFVSTDVGGVRNLAIGDAVTNAAGFEVFANGILVAPDAPQQLAAALGYLAERPDLRRAMGGVGQAAVLKRFSKERLVQDVEALYDALLNPAGTEDGCGR